AKSKDEFLAAKAKRVLDAQALHPELRDGFTDLTLLDKHKEIIDIIFEDTFSDILGNNEIKAAALPYDNFIFKASKRFQKILKEAGPGFEPIIRNQEDEFNYIMAAVVVLNFYYGFKLDFSRPYFYDIPDAAGVMHHYRILYNAEFLELIPTDKAKELNQADLDELLENYDKIDLWKEKIPPGSFIGKGFVISNMFDVTAEHSISEIKSGLISNEKENGDESFMDYMQETFRSFFRLKDIKVGFVAYETKQDQFHCVHGAGMESVILGDDESVSCGEALCPGSYKALMEDNDFFAVTDVNKYYELSGGISPYKNLKEAGYQSAIFAPIADNGNLLGVLEISSPNKNELNSVIATKLEDIMPFIVTAVLRTKIEEENLIDAIIQNECTSVHESVYWRFQEEAKNFIKDGLRGEQPSFKEIVFKDVNPLYGQIDIKDSSRARNTAIQADLTIQLTEINKVLNVAWEKDKLPIYEELIFRVNTYMEDIKDVLYTNSEESISDFVRSEVSPVFEHFKKADTVLKKTVESYEALIDLNTHSYYDHRKNYDESVMKINKKLALVMDQKQEAAQAMFPHYFERYKTDGVEHNMYIGGSIANDKKFDPLYLNNLRLWQLQVMCEMENTHYNLKPDLPVKLDVASLLLVHSTSLSIRFRMDEKQFDVDGTYNARYEIIKKRIDKSHIKGTKERLTQAGKMSIVYSQKKDELEYLRYIKFLRAKGYFTGKVEILELEGLQGVTGLKAIRADILYKKGEESQETYTYEDLMEELNA
ncbi:MAG: GAF domain-containing protein, partial [Maribacter sp.]